MATKGKKGFRGSIDDVLGDLLGYDDKTSIKSARSSQLARGSSERAWGTSSHASKKSFPGDDFFSRLPAEDIVAAEGSSASDADPQDLLQGLKDMGDMDAELLGLSKPCSGPGKTTMKGLGKCDALGGVKTPGKPPAPEKGEPVPVMEKQPLSSPAASRQSKKCNFEDFSDPLARLSSDEEQDGPKKPAPVGTKSTPEKKTERSKEKEPATHQTPLHTVAPVRRRAELTFEDDDDFMDALGFGSGPKGNEKQGEKAEEEELRPARSKLDELLGRGSMAKVLEQPGMGECREFELNKKSQKQPEKEEDGAKEDFVFGAYQPTVASLPKGQLSRRQSVSKFSAENSSKPKPEPRSRPPLPASQRLVQSSRAGGDWLGLKDEAFMDLEPLSPVKASPAMNQCSPATARQPGSASQLPAAEAAVAKPEPLEEESWLTTALARKKAQAQAKAQERNAKLSEAPGEGVDLRSPDSQPAVTTAAPQQAAALQDKAASTSGSRQLLPWLSTTKDTSVPASEAAKGDPSRDASTQVPKGLFPGEQETQDPVSLAQVATAMAHLQAAPQLHKVESPGLGLLHERRLGAPAAQLEQDASGCQAALLSAQAHVAELKSQVRTLELERTQQKLLLESLQRRHQEDLDLLESSYRSQMKVLEESSRRREERLQREKEQQEVQLLGQSQAAEQTRAELLEQHQERLAALKQQNMLELERVRELQRASVQEMRKDHEEQLQRLKQLKEQEIDAVTSALSHTRSLNDVVEQMQKFSSDLRDLSHKLEAMHHSTYQELAMEAQQRDKQFKVLEDRLLQQQRDMVEERSQLQEVMTKMEARLSEQVRLLEQGRWRVTMEQSKMELMQHSLEEQQQVLTHQLSMERTELERAKEQAELKIRGHELKAKEKQLARDRELLDEAWRELRLEKEKVTRAALHIQQREEEVKSMTKLSSQQREEGERALREARRIESEQQSRLQSMQQRLEQLSQQEQQLQQERLSMAHQRRQLQQLCEELSLATEQDLSAPTKGVSSMQVPLTTAAPHNRAFAPDFSPPVRLLPWHSPGVGEEALATASRTELYTTLKLLQLRAQQDHLFLEDEQLFLETLKKAPYNM